MAYSTSTATSPDGLLSAIYTFATANGWTGQTNIGTGGDPANSQRVLDDGAGGVFAMIPQNAGGEIHLQPAAVYDSSSTPFYDHLGSPDNLGTGGTFIKCGGIPNGSSFTYHLFLPNAAPRYIHVVVRNASGIFTHLAFGTCAKHGTFTGGQYASALSWRSSTSTNNAFMFVDAIDLSHATSYVRCDGAFGVPSSRSISSADAGTDRLTVTAHGFTTGAGPVYLTGGSLPGGLDAATNYFVRSISANEITLHLTAAAANAGTGTVNITSTGTGTINAPTWSEEIGYAHGYNTGSAGFRGFMGSLYWGGLIELSQRTPLAPNFLKTEQTGSPGQTIILGHTPDLRIISMEGRNPDGETVTIGSDDWLLFPARTTGSTVQTGSNAYLFTGTAPNHQSNLAGYAYKKIV